MENKRIYRVYAHDPNADEFTNYDSFYTTTQSKEEFRQTLERDHEGTIVIDEIIEYSLDATIHLLNLYIK